jgi:delta24(24(1))-sterol reductase
MRARGTEVSKDLPNSIQHVAKETSKDEMSRKSDLRVEHSEPFEFGGSIGVAALSIGFPLLMWFMWIGATYYDGQIPLPLAGQTLAEFGTHLVQLVVEGAFPNAKAWIIYWSFFLVEALFYCFMPGVWGYGKPLPHEGGKQLPYFCSAYASFYATILIVGCLHVTGIFPLDTLIDEFGPILSVAIISGYINSIVVYAAAFIRGRAHRLTGSPIYDFFMGAELNPRIGILDFKMFYEVRIPWFILFFISCSVAARQYRIYGYVSGEVLFLVMAHFIYANATAKGEQLIITSWYVTVKLIPRYILMTGL